MQLDLRDIHVDSLVQMIRASYILENWEIILQIADALYYEINHLYSIMQEEGIDRQDSNKFKLKRSVIYYFGYSMCLKGVAYEKLCRYDEARECISKYEELGWINLKDAESLAEVEYYSRIARANRYVIELYEGNTAVLPDYIVFLRDNSEETLLGMTHILESAIKHNFNVDEVLDEFEEQIDSLWEFYETKRSARDYIDFIYLKAKYYSQNGKVHESINMLSSSMSSSVKLKDDTGFRKSVALFEKLRDQTTPEQLEEYLGLMDQILD